MPSFDIDAAFTRLTDFIQHYPRAAMYELAEEGYRSSFEQPYISVDVHVHRVMNRWGYVATKTPEKTTKALEEKLPEKYWTETNRLLMPFGKYVCKGRYAECSSCPLADTCPQIGL